MQGHTGIITECSFVSDVRKSGCCEMTRTSENGTLQAPAPGSEDTELGVILEPEVVYGTQTLCTRVQA